MNCGGRRISFWTGWYNKISMDNLQLSAYFGWLQHGVWIWKTSIETTQRCVGTPTWKVGRVNASQLGELHVEDVVTNCTWFPSNLCKDTACRRRSSLFLMPPLMDLAHLLESWRNRRGGPLEILVLAFERISWLTNGWLIVYCIDSYLFHHPTRQMWLGQSTPDSNRLPYSAWTPWHFTTTPSQTSETQQGKDRRYATGARIHLADVC